MQGNRLRPKTSLEKPGGGRRRLGKEEVQLQKGLNVPNGLVWKTPAPASSAPVQLGGAIWKPWRFRAPQVTMDSVPSPERCGPNNKTRTWRRFKSQPPKSEEAGHVNAPFPPSLLYLRNFKNPKTSQYPVTPTSTIKFPQIRSKRQGCFSDLFSNPNTQYLSSPVGSVSECPSLSSHHLHAARGRSWSAVVKGGHGTSR